jgi:hypothetical protein
MTQPRKEQIKDQRSYFTRIDTIGVATPIPFGTPDVPGGTVQTIQNTISENYYNEFLQQTITQTPGGAESDASAFIIGAQGPFVSPVVAGASFTITLPNVNSSNPVLITFQPSDVVNIGGNPYITTSKVAARINAALTVAGVNPSSPVAQNINGQLVLQSAGPSGYTTGSSAFLTVNDVTVGVCTALGLAPGNTATVTGISSPVRGIITQSTDGFGGFIQLRNPDSSPAITQTPIQINVSGLGNIPLYPPGQSIYGRLQQIPGISNNPKFVVSYVRQGSVPGKVITSGGNFSSLTTSDSFTVTVNTVNPALYPNPSHNFSIQTYVLTITFGVAPTGAQDVISAVNAAWNAAAAGAGFPAGTEAGRGGVIGAVAGPWQFITGQDMFFIVLNGNTPIQIYPTTGVYSTSDLVNFINAAISTAGQAAQGSAAVSNFGTLQITSHLTSGPSSTVQIMAGDLFGASPLPTNNFTTTLDKLGLVPGVYSGSVVAKPFGNATTVEEIAFVCPDHTTDDPYGTPASITVSGSSAVMAKLGLSGTSVTGTTAIGIEAVTPPVVHAMIPEMMEFGEVPENIETTTEKFLATDDPQLAQPGAGTENLGISALLGPDGKINPDLLRKIVDVLSIDSLTLGARNLGYLQANQTPRIVTPFSSSQGSGMTLLWEGVSVAGLTGSNAQQIMRLFADSQAGLWVTCNAYWNGPVGFPINWRKDTAGQSASAVYIGQSTVTGQPKMEFLYAGPAVASPFTFAGSPLGTGTPPVGFDPSGALNGALAFILAGTQSTASNENLIPRFLAQTAPSTFTLIWEAQSPTASPSIRIYAQMNPSNETDYWFTINAAWNGVAWAKDVNGVAANAVQMLAGGGFGSQFLHWHRGAADNTPWATWAPNGPASAPNSILPFSINGNQGNAGIVTANNLRLGELAPATLASELAARISVPAHPDSGMRILVAEYGTGPQGSDYLFAAGRNGGCTISAVSAGLATITGLASMTNNMQGMYLYFTGAANGNNNGHFQIVNVISGTSVQIANAAAVAPDGNNGHITWALGGQGQGVCIRHYRGWNFSGNGGYGPGNNDWYAITTNASWNGSVWVPDVPGQNAFMTVWSGSNFLFGSSNYGAGYMYNFSVFQPGGNWSDGSWTCIQGFSDNGIALTHLGDTYNAAALQNTVNGANVIKAWGTIFVTTDSGGHPTFQEYDSWNVHSYAIFNGGGGFGGQILINFYANPSNTDTGAGQGSIACAITPLFFVSGLGPSLQLASMYTSSFSQAQAVLSSGISSTSINFNNANQSGGFTFIITGRQ